MKLQYLGTAAAEGIPGLFCKCSVCVAARERGGREIRTRSQAIVNDCLLIDFPCDTFYHSMHFGIDISAVKHCLITHIHGDHTFPWEFYNLRRGCSHPSENFESFHIYGSSDIEERFSMSIEYAGTERLKLNCVKPFEPFYVCDLRVTALKAAHGSPNPYFYMIEDKSSAILYAHDTHMFPDETWEYLQKSDVKFDIVSLDCTGGAAEYIEDYPHMYLGENKKCRQKLIELSLADGNTTFILNHFSHNGLSVNYKEFCDIAEPWGFDVSYDGKIVYTKL